MEEINLICSDVYQSIKLHWVISKVYMNLFGVHSLCMQPNLVYTSINLSIMEITSYCSYARPAQPGPIR